MILPRTRPPAIQEPRRPFIGRPVIGAVLFEQGAKKPYTITVTVEPPDLGGSRKIAVKLTATELFDFGRVRRRFARFYGLLLVGPTDESWTRAIFDAVQAEQLAAVRREAELAGGVRR